MWDVNETFSLEGRRILGQRQGRSWSKPMTSLPILFFFFLSFLLSLAVTLCGMWQADWNQHCVRAVISQKDIKHAETSISNRPLTALRHRCRRGEMRGRLRLWGDAAQLKCLLQASVKSRKDKIKSIRLSPSSSCFSDSKATGTLDVRRSVCVRVCVFFVRTVSMCFCGSVYVLTQVYRAGGKTLHLLVAWLEFPRSKLRESNFPLQGKALCHKFSVNYVMCSSCQMTTLNYVSCIYYIWKILSFLIYQIRINKKKKNRLDNVLVISTSDGQEFGIFIVYLID